MSETNAISPSPVPQHQSLIDASLAHARESQALRQQISAKAPQLAAVLEMFEQQEHEQHQQQQQHYQAQQEQQRAAQQAMPRRARGAGLLDLVAGLLANAFPSAAPLFHGCRAFLQLKLIHKKAG